jgi:hypothetical protein
MHPREHPSSGGRLAIRICGVGEHGDTVKGCFAKPSLDADPLVFLKYCKVIGGGRDDSRTVASPRKFFRQADASLAST